MTSMANGNWFVKEMARAEAKVAAHGYEGADLREIMLMGFKHLSETNSVIRVELHGKVLFPVGVMLGGLLVGAITQILRVVV